MDNLSVLNQRFETAHPQEILQWAANQYRHQLAIVTSFQPTGIITLHMLREIAPDITILTLDTGLLFPETVALTDHLERLWGLHLIRVRPVQTVAQQAETYGDALWTHNPDLCCNLRKVTPLSDALQPFSAWITGVRRDQANTRAATPVVSWDAKYNKVKLSPFATWTEDMVWSYIHAYGLPYNVLHDQQYPSIGCWPCTRAVKEGDDARRGRWAGLSKQECGIHVQASA